MMRALKLLFVVFVAVSFTTGSLAQEPVKAAEPGERKIEKPKKPDEIVDDTVARVLKILGDPDYDKPDKKPVMREKVRKTILAQVDMDLVSVLTLAQFRKKLSKEQFEKFTDLFSRLLFTTYITHLEKYSDEKVVIVGTDNVSDTKTRVKTKTITDTREIPVDYSFALQGKRWWLYDIHVEGVSLVRNYRTQFREILLKKSPEEFLEQVAEKVKENEKKL
jgi:phospholipid transport system substrate-binding protein